MRRTILNLVALLVMAFPLSAQICDPGKSIEACVLEQLAAASLTDRVVNKSTGQNPELPGTISTVNDFLSLLRMSLASGGLWTDDGQESFTVELNNFLGIPVSSGYKLQAIARNPKLFDKLGEKLPDDTRDDRVAELEGDLGDLDDVSLIFTFSPMNSWLGRKPELYLAEQSAFFEAIKVGEASRKKAFFKENDEVNRLLQNLPDNLIEQAAEARDKGGKISDLDPDDAAALEAAMARELAANEDYRASLERALERAGFFAFADLVANQPQAYVNVEWSSPDELVGPRKLLGKATYEHGFVNVNNLRRSCGATNMASDGQAAALATCLHTYLTPQRLTQLRRGDRLAVSVEYTDVEDYKVVLDQDNVTLELPADRKLVGSVAFGRYLSFFEDGSGNTRVDLDWKYEDYGDDPNRKDRSVVTLTFSQKMIDDMVLSLGVVYANKPEFRGDVDKELSARAGLSYKFDRQENF